MTASLPEADRNVIPRWRDPAATAREGELAALHPSAGWYVDETALREREEDWTRNRSLPFATDLVGSALVVGPSSLAREAAGFILEESEHASPLARAVAHRVLGAREEGIAPGGEPENWEIHEDIHDLKVRLRRDPRNAIAWAEIARFYTIRGHQRQAERAMLVALALSGNHRYVLRAASRLAVHHGDFGRAHAVIAESARTPSDPWLVATELATSGLAGRRPRLVKHGRRMLESGSFSPRSVTELASALGTIELRAGSDRKARRLFEASLAEPNDNSIAQGEWVSRQLRSLNVPQEQLESSAEAQAYRSSREGEWHDALKAAWEWHFDQPFASRPAELGSYEASVGMAYEEGVRIALAGLRANPGEFLLTNNLVFCLVHLGQLDEAATRFQEINPEGLDRESKVTYLATAGLLSFRRGAADEGRALYQEAIEQTREKRTRAIAMILLAAEELRANVASGPAIAHEARAVGESVWTPDIKLWLAHLSEPLKLKS